VVKKSIGNVKVNISVNQVRVRMSTSRMLSAT